MTKKSKSAWGNRATKIVHSNAQGDQCRKSEVLAKNIEEFPEGHAEAVKAGYKPCKVCLSEID